MIRSIHCSWHCRCRTYFCCFPLALANTRLWPLVPFFQISLKNIELKTTHISFGIVACTFSDNLSRNSLISNAYCDINPIFFFIFSSNYRQAQKKLFFVCVRSKSKCYKNCMFYAHLMNMHLFLPHIYLLSLGLIA